MRRATLERLTPERLAKHAEQGGRILDVREPPMYAEAHLRGSLNVPLSNRAAPYWLQTLVVAEQPLAVVTASERESSLVLQLLGVAERSAIGFAPFDPQAFADAGLEITSIRLLVPTELAARREEVTVVDVREPEEWVAGHVPGALWIPLADLPERVGEVPAGPVAAICASGFRSSTAASLLEAAGWRDLANVWGGTTAWMQSGLPVNRGTRP